MLLHKMRLHGEIECKVQFLSCSTEATKSEKQKALKKHKTTTQKKVHCDKIKENYQNMEPAKKKLLLETSAQKYKSMGDSKKAQYIEINNQRVTEKYKLMGSLEKKHVIESIVSKRRKSIINLGDCISQFRSKVKQGPCYICSVCNRLLYKVSVTLLNRNKYTNVCGTVYTNIKSYDAKEYICKTCNLNLSKGKIPCQAVCNNMYVDHTPPELACLEKLEQVLIAQRIVFEKIIVMPKGQQKKVKGAICNVPVECDDTCKVLPRPPERSGIIMLKLKRKLEFRGHVYFQAGRPQFILNALNWLKLNNPLYKYITINIKNISSGFTSFEDDSTNEDCSRNDIDQHGQNEEIDDPLNTHRQATSETCLQSLLPDYPAIIDDNDTNRSLGNEVYSIAPGENKHPISIMTDIKCEELAFPVLFPKGQYGYKDVNRNIKLSPVKYFNARLLHYSGQFATNPEYLFFAQFVTEQKKVSDSINIALKKIHGQCVTAAEIRSDVNKLKGLVCQNQAYLFLRNIPGTPPYWQKFMYEVIAMVKQLGIPTWFMTLSCADLRWPELFQIIARTQGKNLTDDQVKNMSYNERCSMLNLNPVVVAKHFQHRVETFFTEILLSKLNPIGKIVYYALRIEFQMRGSPHLHALIWTSDCPTLTSENSEAYVKFVDKHVQAFLPDEQTDPELHNLVKTYQKHNHSKTCRKYKNVTCRFNFGKFFTNRTLYN